MKRAFVVLSLLALSAVSGCGNRNQSPLPATAVSEEHTGATQPVPQQTAWKWTPGDYFFVKILHESTMSVNLGDRVKKTTNEDSAVLRIDVKTVSSDGTIQLTCKAEDFKSNEKHVINVDLRSLLLNAGPLNVSVKSSLDSFTIHLKPGQPRALESLMRYWLAELLVPVPGKNVHIGDTWEHRVSTNLEGLGKLAIVKHYLCKGPGAGDSEEQVSATYTAASTFSLTTADNKLPFEIKKMDISNSECHGDLVFDLRRGRLVNSTMKMGYDMKMTVANRNETRDLESHTEESVIVRVEATKPTLKD